MKLISYPLFILLLSTLSCSNDQKNGDQEIISEESLFTAMESNRQWPSYRGFFASGYLDNAVLPTTQAIRLAFSVILSQLQTHLNTGGLYEMVL